MRCDQPPKTLEELKQGILFASTDTFDLVVIDRSGEFRFPPKKGVGLARKICSDVGLALVQKGLCTSPWIHNTDGDARVPADYFLQVEKLDPKSCSASFYEFRHESGEDKDETHWQAAQLYESWLRYYRLGLQYAGSPYDFHTIGSTITINANHYSLVHGFPRREAGEDIYLLNKLAKVGKILKLEGDPIILEDRLSSRVPFGTGQGTQKIKDSIVKGEDYRVYHPIVFDCLKTYLSLVSTCILSGGDFSTMLNEISNKSIAETISNLEVDTLKAIQDATQRSKTREAALLQFHHWFDAFKTLKFIHFCRDQGMGTLMIQDAVEKSVFINGPSNNLEHLRVADSQS